MPISNNILISRRSAIAAAFVTMVAWQPQSSRAGQTERPAPIDLGHGLEIRDYRLFPTDDVMRFLVEIHNTTNRIVDTPSVGVMLPHKDQHDFGWAIPFAGVTHPNSSQGLIGIAPRSIASDDDWGTPEWVICDDIHHDFSDIMQDWNVEITWDFRIRELDDAVSKLTITNLGDSSTGPASVHGLVWNNEGRLCGATSSAPIRSLAPGAQFETWAHIWSTLDYIANPFTLIDNVDDVDDIEVTYSIQPRNLLTTQGCAPILPWSH